MLQAQLNSLTKDFTATSAAAQRTLKGLFGRRPAKPVVDVDGMPTARLRPGYGTGSTGRLQGMISVCILMHCLEALNLAIRRVVRRTYCLAVPRV